MREEGGELNIPHLLEDQISTFLLAGHETVANMLAWTFHLLSLSPVIQENARTVVKRELGDEIPVHSDLRGSVI